MVRDGRVGEESNERRGADVNNRGVTTMRCCRTRGTSPCGAGLDPALTARCYKPCMSRNSVPAEASDTVQGADGVRVLLFNADGADRRIQLETLRLDTLSPRQLAWIDLLAPETGDIAPLLQKLGLERLPLTRALDPDSAPLCRHQDWFVARAFAPTRVADGAPQAQPWLLAVGPNAVLTVHRATLPFLDALFVQEDPDSQLGVLSADAFAAALLDRMLTVYLDAIADFEDRVDALEMAIMEPKLRAGQLKQLRDLRHTVSRLRRLLTSHRGLFDALPRPDFRPDLPPEVNAHYVAVSARYERTVDAVENARDLVLGSFELLAARLSQRTNDSMRLLTFVTALLGTLAVIAGVMGMNFDAPVFATGARGLWTTIGGMAALVIAALLFARRRRWWR